MTHPLAKEENPVRGDLWYDPQESKLKVYDGDNWIIGDNTTLEEHVSPPEYLPKFHYKGNLITAHVGIDPPEDPVQGDVWYDPELSRVFMWNEEEWIKFGRIDINSINSP